MSVARTSFCLSGVVTVASKKSRVGKKPFVKPASTSMAGARPVRCALSPTSTQPSAASKAGALIRFRARAIRVWASLGAAVSVSEEVGATAFDGAGTGAFASEEVSEVDTTGLGSGAVRARTSCIACSPFSPVKLRAEARAPISSSPSKPWACSMRVRPVR